MTDYLANSDLVVESGAVEVDRRCSDTEIDIEGSVVSVDGVVSHVVVDGDLSQSDLDALEAEFGVSWTKR